jgi:hypothetical protein
MNFPNYNQMINWAVAQIDLAELAHKAGPIGRGETHWLGLTEGQTDLCPRSLSLVSLCSTPTSPSPLTAASARLRRRLPLPSVANGPDLTDLHRHPGRFARLATLVPDFGNPGSPEFGSLPALLLAGVASPRTSSPP